MAVALHHILCGFVVAESLELRPLAGVAVPRQLDAIEIGIVQIKREVCAVVVVAVDLPAAVQQPPEGIGEIAPGRIVDGEMIEPGRSSLRRFATSAFPSIQSDVVVIPARGQKRGAAQMVEQIETEYIAIELDGAVEIGDLEMDMPDMGSAGID